MPSKLYNHGANKAQLLKTGQTTSYHADDDGDLELGIAPSYTVLTTGRYSGTVNLTINGKTHATNNACVQNSGTGKMWHREIIQSDIGPAGDGRLFWKQWTLASESCIFATAGDTITAAAGTPFNVEALCAGRKITISGTIHNNGVVTVTNITTSVITVSENLTDEGPVNTTFATKDDLMWDLLAQANANSLAGYTDWRIPNLHELGSLVDFGHCDPTINATVFPSTPATKHWVSSTYPCTTAKGWNVDFYNGDLGSNSYKTINKFHIRLIRN